MSTKSAPLPSRPPLNGEIHFYRLLMAVQVVLFHVLGGGGYLAVDFFFLLSGYFAVRRASAHPDASYRDAMRWTLAKFARIYPYVVPICAVHLLARALALGEGPADAMRALFYGSFQIGLTSASGLFSGSHNFLSHLWYLSCLLVLLPVFFSLLIRSRDFFLHVGAPLCALFFYGYCARTAGHLCLSHEWPGLFLLGMPRAWAGLCAGALVYLLADRLRALPPLSRLGGLLLSAAELLCLFAGLFYMRTQALRMLDFLCVALWVLLAAVALSERAPVHRLFSPFARLPWLGDYCLALYVSHWTVPVLLRRLTADASVPVAPYLLTCLAYAALWVALIAFVRRLNIGKKIKTLLFL